MKQILPSEIQSHLQSLMPADVFSRYMQDFFEPRLRHVSARPGICLRDWKDELPGLIEQDGSYFFPPDYVFAHCPGYHAGLYYPQEFSAAQVVELVGPGSFSALDLCAAPGGKSWQLQGKIIPGGYVWSNEPIPKRQKILSANLERGGFRQRVLSQASPLHLAEFGLLMDLVLVDAPCSGEGLFRKHQESIKEWSPKAVSMCVQRQEEILDAAALLVAPGSFLLYSTCTFNTSENEDQVHRFLFRHPEFTCMKQLRLWPDSIQEGHFAALFKKVDEPQDRTITTGGRVKIRCGRGEYMVPASLKDSPLLNQRVVTEPGVYCGEAEDSYSLAKSLTVAECESGIQVTRNGVLPWIRGETLPTQGKLGKVAVFWREICLGFGRDNGLRIQNLVPKGIRTYIPRY